MNNLPDYLKRKNQNSGLKYKDIDIVHLITILLRNKIEGQSENVLNSRLKNLKDKFYESRILWVEIIFKFKFRR